MNPLIKNKTELAPAGVDYILVASKFKLSLPGPLTLSLFVANHTDKSQVRRKGFAVSNTSIGSHLVIRSQQEVLYRSEPFAAKIKPAFNHSLPIVVPSHSELELAEWNIMEMEFETAQADIYGEHNKRPLRDIIHPGHYTIEWNDGELLEYLPGISNPITIVIS